jgi:hypothetical protein
MCKLIDRFPTRVQCSMCADSETIQHLKCANVYTVSTIYKMSGHKLQRELYIRYNTDANVVNGL